MYLSRIKLNTGIRATIKLLSSPQVVHATVEASFAEDNKTRKLWRLDYFQGHPYVIILSQNKPDLTQFATQFGYPECPGEIHDYQKVLEILKDGQRYRFRLCANPVHSVSQGEGKRGKVMAHVTITQQEEWLKSKSDKLGFTLKQFMVVQHDMKRFTRQHKYVTLGTATFEGILQIENVALFKDTLINGIGRGKAYGCGLLTLARL
jgi:CRISPR system Cascade subunit CasE